MNKFLLYVSVCFSILSCNPDNFISERAKNKNQKTNPLGRGIKNVGILHFDSPIKFKNFIDLKLKEDKDYLKASKSVTDYNSLLYLTNLSDLDLKKINIDKRSLPKVKSNDDLLLFLLNENGEISIGNKIYRIDGDFVFEYTKGFQKDILRFKKENNVKKLLARGSMLQYTKNLNIYMHDNFISKVKYNYFDDRHRMKSVEFSEYWYFYSVIGSTTTVQQKDYFGLWDSLKAYNGLSIHVKYQADSINFGSQNQSSYTENYINSYDSDCIVAQKNINYCVLTVKSKAAPYKYKLISGRVNHWSYFDALDNELNDTAFTSVSYNK